MKALLHDDEIQISNELVRDLVDQSFPEFARLPLHRLGVSGSTNNLFRLGKEFIVRLPRQVGGGAAIAKEFQWQKEFSATLPVAIPETIGLGEPRDSFAEQWSIVRWIEGSTPDLKFAQDDLTKRLKLAVDLADVVLAIRATPLPTTVISEASLQCYRGRPIAEFDKLTRHNIERCRSIHDLTIDLDAALAVWIDAMEIPESHHAGKTHWYHGDLVAENLLVSDGNLCAVLDFGGLGVGDATIDLHGAWGMFDTSCREAFRCRLDVDESEWLRGRAWALGVSLNAIPYYWTTMPTRMKDRVGMVQSVLDDARYENG